MRYYYVQWNEVSHCTYTNNFYALCSFEISYSITPSSWEAQAFENISSILWGHPKKVNNYFDISLFFFVCFWKWNAIHQPTRVCWIHTGKQKGNIALFILHKWYIMIFHLCYLAFFSLKVILDTHAVVHIWMTIIASFLSHGPVEARSIALYWD